MSYKTPEAFRQALDARIRREALERGTQIPRIRQIVVFDRFLARCFHVLGDRVVVKGGAVLELRLGRARTTRDVDLRVVGDPNMLLPLLERAAGVELGDFFNFAIESDAEHPELQGDGVVYEGRRFRAEARLAGKLYGERFGVDAGFGDILTAEPELLDGTDLLAFADVPRARLRVYPRETHVAEKLHAYTLPRPRENSRVKDLPDLALLASTGAFNAAALRRAIVATFDFRQTHPVPAALPEPPASWDPSYRQMASKDGLPWHDLAAVADAARSFIDPILLGDGGEWSPSRWRWARS